MTMLEQAIEAAKSRDRETARRLLAKVVKEEADNEIAWSWLVYCAKSTAERKRYLEKILEINPANLEAQEALEKLEAKIEASKEKEKESNSAKTAITIGGICALLGLLIFPLWFGLAAIVCGLFAISEGNKGGVLVLLVGIIDVAYFLFAMGII